MAKRSLILKLLLPILLGLPTKLPAQDTLSGRVVDSTSMNPLPFVTVYFDGTTVGSVTDEDGRFVLPLDRIQLPALLSVSQIGFEGWALEVRKMDTSVGSLTSSAQPCYRLA
ncbi:MAG: carboxypeptidase-like regulatory domain-containing protein, partial [Bacteroidota bacterium]